MEHQSIVRTFVLLRYGDMYYDTTLFLKNCVKL